VEKQKGFDVNAKILSWLNKEIRPVHRRSAPSTFARKIRKVFSILILLLPCTFVLWRALLWHEIDSQFARIRAAGLPVSGAELNAWRGPLADAENGALILTQAFALVRTFPDSRSNEVAEPKILIRTNVWTSDIRAQVEEYVHMNEPALAQIQEGLLRSRFHYPIDFSYGPETELPHLASLKTVAHLAALRTALAAETGQADAWPENLEVQLKLARTLDEEPTVISFLVRSAMIRTAVRVTERSLNCATPSDEMCNRLQDAFAQLSRTNLLPNALVGERAMNAPIFRLSWKEIQSLGPDEDQSQPRKPQPYSGKATPFLWLTGVFERDLNFFLKTMEQSKSLAALPPPQSLALTNYLESAGKVSDKRFYFLSSMLLPAYSRVVVREASTRSLIDLSITAFAVERFRQQRGQLPAALTELTPEFLEKVPRDAFDGAPLRYRVLAKGYVIYSVDSDGQDNGGREGPERKRPSDRNSYDLTLMITR
jgi:hypothetical protein